MLYVARVLSSVSWTEGLRELTTRAANALLRQLGLGELLWCCGCGCGICLRELGHSRQLRRLYLKRRLFYNSRITCDSVHKAAAVHQAMGPVRLALEAFVARPGDGLASTASILAASVSSLGPCVFRRRDDLNTLPTLLSLFSTLGLSVSVVRTLNGERSYLPSCVELTGI